MKVSLITVCYNSARTLQETIDSVLSQTYAEIEYIIIDGGSTDATPTIIEPYKSRIAHYVSEPDEGLYDAMNKGIALSSGDMVGILNSDDMLAHSNVIADIVKAMDSNTDAVCSDVFIFKNTKDNIVRRYRCTRWKPWMFRLGHQPPHPGFFVRRNCYEKYGLFDVQFKRAADFELLFRFGADAKRWQQPAGIDSDIRSQSRRPQGAAQTWLFQRTATHLVQICTEGFSVDIFKTILIQSPINFGYFAIAN
jgi:glycosyltransferase involved in cell wall biosynthesis